ncbi:hypothetical protein N9N28_11125 [Rubripirellula amarantea]|nr:hypothetical protein [Rubripirellula amarantea]
MRLTKLMPGKTFACTLLVLAATSMTEMPSRVDAQTFDFVDASGVPTAKIELGRGRLIVYEHTGERIYFSRDSRYDSVGGGYLGYYNPDLNRVMRFPRSGVGPLQVADFDDPFPRYTTTIRSLRRARPGKGGIAIPRPGFVPAPSLGASAPGWGGPFYPPTFGVYPGLDPYGAAFPPSNGLGYGPIARPPQSVVLDSKIVSGPPLSPARVSFVNDGPRPVEVAIVDRKEPSKQRAFLLAPRQSQQVTLERDPTQTRIQNVRVVTLDGDAITKEITSELSPSDRYEVVVREQQIQSIAIDRTPGGNNAIEDINFSGKGLGRFLLPPGDELQSGTIQVYSAAKSQGNANTVSPILAEEDYRDQSSPLERVLRDAQRSD